MAVKTRTVFNKLPKMQVAVEKLHGTRVNVGYLGGGEAAKLAGIHEYGCRIPVTDKMRGYLASQGLFLKKETKEIVIPERSFLRAGFDTHHRGVIAQAEEALPQVLEGSISAGKLGELVGLLLRGKIQTYAVDLRNPANHPFTKEQKGSSNPLVDSGEMIGAIGYEVKRGNG